MLKGGSLVSHISILYGNVCLGTLLLHLIEVSGGGEGGRGDIRVVISDPV